MPKLRNSSTDLGAFAQGVGRKIANHNPLVELKVSRRERDGRPNIYRAASRGMVAAVADAENIIVCAPTDRYFKLTVEEIAPAEFAALNLVTVKP